MMRCFCKNHPLHRPDVDGAGSLNQYLDDLGDQAPCINIIIFFTTLSISCIRLTTVPQNHRSHGIPQSHRC
jgi:hypothetical protein